MIADGPALPVVDGPNWPPPLTVAHARAARR